MMLPIELRTYREPDAQLQYEPFRTTVFTRSRDDLASARGPGALFREEWNSLAGNAQRYKPLSLYRTERDVNPTLTATVQRFYDPHESTDVGSQATRKGNAVVSLKSNVPRFDNGSSEEIRASQRGPGSYFPDRYHGAFPALFDKMTPRTVCLEKLQAKRTLAATFGIMPVPPANSPVATLPLRGRPARVRAPQSSDDLTVHRRTFADSLEIPVETTRLAPALTPRNAYSNPANRRCVLAMRTPDQPRESV
ncbi:hypothetical protein PHYPSEUDO_010589 [Phytophthora pseudosyringae]|uniref:Uncharacterized protein n=1 Tax=Phytophthora pseudosyringae TaxID=221518 RepID=A0A8T1V9W0_9STRA|nr:hypothetical protein PHYPSEUDO_010589 [Phytophthora pseudosyringae]